MNRRRFLCLTSAAALGLAGPAQADFVDQVRQQLVDQGYRRISVTTTLLGRSQLIASGKKGQREIIMNPRTGEILRDVWVSRNGASGPAIVGSEEDDEGGKGRGRGGDDDGDDDGGDDSGGDDSGGEGDSGGHGEGGGDGEGGDE